MYFAAGQLKKKICQPSIPMRRVKMKSKAEQMQSTLLRQWPIGKLEMKMKYLAKSDA
jgi:hypothetical protein